MSVQSTKNFLLNIDSKYADVQVTIVYYEPGTLVCTEVHGSHEVEIRNKIMKSLNQNDKMMQTLFNKDENINSTYDIYLNIDGLTTKSVEDVVNKMLKDAGLKACVIETSEAYDADEDEDPHSDLYDGLSMYEAYIENKNEEQVSETTGRYCDLSSVKDELIGFAHECLDNPPAKEDKKEAPEAFCPMCCFTVEYSPDTNECNTCGSAIPDGVIELEQSSKKHYTESQHLQKAFAGLGYSKDDIKNIIEAQPVMFIQPDNDTKTEGEPDSVRYFAVGQVKDGLFTGLVHGYEGGGEYSDHCMLDGKYMPHISDDECIGDETMEAMLNLHTDKSFLQRCHASLYQYITYSEDGYFFEINDRKKFDAFKSVPFERPDYGNTIFGNVCGYWSNEEYLVQKCNIKELVKQAATQHHAQNTELNYSTLVEEAIRSLRNDETYGPFMTEKMEEILREYLDTIFLEMEARGVEMNEVNLVDSDTCVACNTVLLPNDELYSDSEGNSLCDRCSTLCESCDAYQNVDTVVQEDSTTVCMKCAKK